MVATDQLVSDAVQLYGNQRTALLPILRYVVEKRRWLDEASILEIAAALSLSSADVFGVASFYSFLETKPMGQNVIRVCRTITCFIHGKDEIVKALEEKLKVKMGETTADRKFTLVATNCMGWCHKGPAMLINDKAYTQLTPEMAIKALEEYI